MVYHTEYYMVLHFSLPSICGCCHSLPMPVPLFWQVVSPSAEQSPLLPTAFSVWFLYHHLLSGRGEMLQGLLLRTWV